MRTTIVAAALSAVLGLSCGRPALADPASFRISIPLRFGAGHAARTAALERPGQLRFERRLRLTRYALQLTDAIISTIGYRAYARCLSCLAFPGGGPRGSAALSLTNINGGRPAEVDPLIAPFSHGGFFSLAVGTLAYDTIDARIERHWPLDRRIAADTAEIGAHVWGIATWLPELHAIHRDTQVAAACGAQWQARKFGEAFSNGCVNEYYRAAPANSLPGMSPISPIFVCAPARFGRGTFLFATSTSAVVASGTACTDLPSAFP